MKTIRHLTLLFFAALALAAHATGDLVVVVAAQSPIPNLSRDQVVNIYLGRYRQLPNGSLAVPYDLTGDLPERTQFYRLLVGKDEEEIRAYWARLIFSGSTSPPRESPAYEDLVLRLTNNRLALGYLDRSRVDGRLRIIFDLGGPGREHTKTP